MRRWCKKHTLALLLLNKKIDDQIVASVQVGIQLIQYSLSVSLLSLTEYLLVFGYLFNKTSKQKNNNKIEKKFTIKHTLSHTLARSFDHKSKS